MDNFLISLVYNDFMLSRKARWIRNHNRRGFRLQKTFGGFFRPIRFRRGRKLA